MTITETTSDTPQTCFRCTSLGLPPNGIAAGEKHFLIVAPAKTDTACVDCYNRMFVEITKSSEGEEWKENK
jgi:hypothetical protein